MVQGGICLFLELGDPKKGESGIIELKMKILITIAVLIALIGRLNCMNI